MIQEKEVTAHPPVKLVLSIQWVNALEDRNSDIMNRRRHAQVVDE